MEKRDRRALGIYALNIGGVYLEALGRSWAIANPAGGMVFGLARLVDRAFPRHLPAPYLNAVRMLGAGYYGLSALGNMLGLLDTPSLGTDVGRALFDLLLFYELKRELQESYQETGRFMAQDIEESARGLKGLAAKLTGTVKRNLPSRPSKAL